MNWRSCFVVLCALTTSPGVSAGSKLAGPEACTLTLPYTESTVKAECASLGVAENPENPHGQWIDLQIAVLKARTANPAPDPVFFFAGGPGQSAIDLLIQQQHLFAELVKRRDIVFIDQRGTGRSNLLTCDIEDPTETVLEDEQVVALTRLCLDQLPGDPRFYATRHAIEDVEAVRSALGYQQINLMGGSYGTRVAQEYLRKYPAQVRSIVIDSIASPGDVLGAEHSKNLTDALHKVVEKCHAQTTCRQAFPELASSLATYLAMDVQEIRTVEFRHPSTGEWQTEQVTREVADLAVRMYAYDAKSLSLLPLMITRAARGEWRELIASSYLIAEQMDGMMSPGMHNAVMCSEDAYLYPETETAGRNAILGRLTHIIGLMCAEWPVAGVDTGVHEPLDSDIPALLLSGEMDPVTPPRYGDSALAQFSNGTHLVGRGLGHIVSSNRCFKKVVAGFVDELAVPEQAASCTDRDWSSSFFTSLAGAESD